MDPSFGSFVLTFDIFSRSVLEQGHAGAGKDEQEDEEGTETKGV